MTDIRHSDPGFNKTQHCTAVDCYTFSHTAQYCGQPQPRRCGCPYDYEEDATSQRDGEEALRAELIDLLFEPVKGVMEYGELVDALLEIIYRER